MKLKGEYIVQVETLPHDDEAFGTFVLGVLDQHMTEVDDAAIEARVASLREIYPTANASCHWTRPRPPASGWTVWREPSLRPKGIGEVGLFAPPEPPGARAN